MPKPAMMPSRGCCARRWMCNEGLLLLPHRET
jgi:hypothetical protein